jgi:putative PIN family toxin of toxin-antitoxin system
VIRVVLDTNVIVSALLQPLGAPAAVFLLVAAGAVQLCVSGNIYAEYEEVIHRRRADLPAVLSTFLGLGPSLDRYAPGFLAILSGENAP